MVRVALGARREAPESYSVPSEATIRRTLARLDAEVLAGVIGVWLADRDRPDQRRRALAVDGKTLRGAKRGAVRSTCFRRWSTPPGGWWPNTRSAAPPARSPPSSRCWPRWTWPASWSPPMPSKPTPRPHSQVLQVTRKTRDLHTRHWKTKVVYAVTSLTVQQASPARLADLIRGHWQPDPAGLTGPQRTM
jgi:hypothetical protein